MDRRVRGAQFSAERVMIAVFAMVGFCVRVCCRTDMLKIRFPQRRLVWRERVLGRATTAKEKDCDERRENG
jgi:hypothetical protein